MCRPVDWVYSLGPRHQDALHTVDLATPTQDQFWAQAVYKEALPWNSLVSHRALKPAPALPQVEHR